jgi:hypothetical protein
LAVVASATSATATVDTAATAFNLTI